MRTRDMGIVEQAIDYAASHSEAEVSQAVEELNRLLDGPPTGLPKRFKDEVSRWEFIIGETDDVALTWLPRRDAS